MNAGKKQLDSLEEVWIRWEPDASLKLAYDIISVQDNMDTLKIVIGGRKTDQELEVIFDSTWAYRTTDETLRLNLSTQLSQKYGTEFYANWSFFKIENSNYMKWLLEQSGGYAEEFNLKHFVIMGSDFIVDIAAAEEPKFKIINKQK